MDILLATTNKNKVEEYKQILKPFGFNVLSINDLKIKISEIKEDGNTFSENSLIKAKALTKFTNLPIIADDSGLCIKSLDDFPGIYSSRFVKQCGSQLKANQEIVNKLKNKDHTAKFCCAIALILDSKQYVFEGIVNGSIVSNYDNSLSFGYDPIFIPDGYDKTFSSLSKSEKNKISHRGKACKKLVDFLKNIK